MNHRDQDVPARPGRRRRAWPAVANLVALAVLLGACGGTSSGGAGVATAADGKTTTTTAKKTDARQAGLDFARCMREHGVEMPDPTFDEHGDAQMGFQAGAGGGDVAPAGELDATFREADKACRHHLDGVAGNGPDGKPDAEMQEKALKFARCMREHGVANFPDPDFTEGGMVRIGGEGIDPFSPTTQEAQKQCQAILGAPPTGEPTGGRAAPIGGAR